MSRSFRFVRYDAAFEPLGELSLVCLDGADALLVGQRLGWRVEVWDGPHVLGVVGDGALAVLPQPDALLPRGPFARPPRTARPTLQPESSASADVGPRAFNPFRKGVWRRSAT